MVLSAEDASVEVKDEGVAVPEPASWEHLEGVEGFTMVTHFEVQMRSGRVACGTHLTQGSAGFEKLSDLHRSASQMRIPSTPTLSMIELYKLSVVASRTDENDSTSGNRYNGSPGRRRDINPLM